MRYVCTAGFFDAGEGSFFYIGTRVLRRVIEGCSPDREFWSRMVRDAFLQLRRKSIDACTAPRPAQVLYIRHGRSTVVSQTFDKLIFTHSSFAFTDD